MHVHTPYSLTHTQTLTHTHTYIHTYIHIHIYTTQEKEYKRLQISQFPAFRTVNNKDYQLSATYPSQFVVCMYVCVCVCMCMCVCMYVYVYTIGSKEHNNQRPDSDL